MARRKEKKSSRERKRRRHKGAEQNRAEQSQHKGEQSMLRKTHPDPTM